MSKLSKMLRRTMLKYGRNKSAVIQNVEPTRIAGESAILGLLNSLLVKTDHRQNPNLNELAMLLKDFDAVKLNVKNFGYELGRELQKKLPVAHKTTAQSHVISSRATTQNDVEAEWFAHWCRELKIPVTYHRKIWEFCFLLQTLHDAKLLNPGLNALGFGCGEEPIPSYLASIGASVTVTDLDPETVRGMGWAETGQHTDSLAKSWYPDIVDQGIFNKNVSLRYVDMNNIPVDLTGYDMCWSICALEHLGSIRKGLDFIKNSLATLRDGGWAVHTTEFNYLSPDKTTDNWQTVLFLRKHFELVRDELQAQGHLVAPMNFDVGNRPLDRFIDVPPFSFGEGWLTKEQWGDVGQAAHLKLTVDGFPSTCFGIAVQKRTR
jgi:2-polyprenyl-3-methyl-5-hydroxy-6-metoxy-1,4-benzoquinol methylase